MPRGTPRRPDGGTTVAQGIRYVRRPVLRVMRKQRFAHAAQHASDRQISAFGVKEASGRATRVRLVSSADLQGFMSGTWGCRGYAPVVALS